MENLNLEREHHYLIAMAPTFTCVKTMELNGCVSRNAGRLGRFITSFPSLSELKMSGLSIRPSSSMFPQYRPASSCLQELNLTLGANVHLLLDYFVQAGPFVTHLTKLVLKWVYFDDVEQHSSVLQGVGGLLKHCGRSLEKLWIYVENSGTGPIPDSIMEQSAWFVLVLYIYDSILTCFMFTVSIAPLTNLRELLYSYRNSGNISKFAYEHLKTVSTENKVTQVYLLQQKDFGEEAEDVDELLATERFRFLSQLQVQSEEQVRSFAKLKARGVRVTSLW